jgi:hypothetical protein
MHVPCDSPVATGRIARQCEPASPFVGWSRDRLTISADTSGRRHGRRLFPSRPGVLASEVAQDVVEALWLFEIGHVPRIDNRASSTAGSAFTSCRTTAVEACASWSPAITNDGTLQARSSVESWSPAPYGVVQPRPLSESEGGAAPRCARHSALCRARTLNVSKSLERRRDLCHAGLRARRVSVASTSGELSTRRQSLSILVFG